MPADTQTGTDIERLRVVLIPYAEQLVEMVRRQTPDHTSGGLSPVIALHLAFLMDGYAKAYVARVVDGYVPQPPEHDK